MPILSDGMHKLHATGICLTQLEATVFMHKRGNKNLSKHSIWRISNTFKFQQISGAVVCMEKLNANTMRSRRVHVTFTTRRRTDSISGPAAYSCATSGERLFDKRIPADNKRHVTSVKHRLHLILLISQYTAFTSGIMLCYSVQNATANCRNY